jgi:tetratricopeptide (TPR) repeat protein
LLSGRIDDARERALEGLRITTETRYRLGIAWAHRVLGRIALAAGDPPGARTCFDEALRTQREIPARHEMGRTYLDLARLAHREGKGKDAHAHLADALGLFLQLRVPRYVEQTHALAAELGVARLSSPEAVAPPR